MQFQALFQKVGFFLCPQITRLSVLIPCLYASWFFIRNTDLYLLFDSYWDYQSELIALISLLLQTFCEPLLVKVCPIIFPLILSYFFDFSFSLRWQIIIDFGLQVRRNRLEFISVFFLFLWWKIIQDFCLTELCNTRRRL